MRQTLLPAAALATLLALTGCATTGTDLLPVKAGQGDDELMPVEVTDPADDLLPVEVKDPADDLLPVEVAVSGAECVPGAWLLDNASWRDLIVQQAAGQGVTVQTPTGSVIVTFADGGRYSVDYRAWEIQMQTEDGSIVMKRAGKDAGQYSTTTSKVVMTESSAGSVAQGTVVTSSGTFSLPASSSQTAFVDTFSYTCTNDAMTATVPEGTLRLSRQR
jgi:hypothetical protein